MRPLRVLPWSLLVALFVFAAATWGVLPDLVPTKINGSGEGTHLVARSLWSWFGMPIFGLATHLLLAGLGALAPRHPEMLNHPDKARLLRLPRAYQAPAIAELRGLLDLTSTSVMVTFLLVQWMLWRVASGRPSPLALPLVLVSAVLTTPAILIYSTRIGTAIEASEKRWHEAGSPAE